MTNTIYIIVIIVLLLAVVGLIITRQPPSSSYLYTTTISPQIFSHVILSYADKQTIANNYSYDAWEIQAPNTATQLNLTGSIVSDNKNVAIGGFIMTQSQFANFSQNFSIKTPASPQYGIEYTYYFGFTGGIGGAPTLDVSTMLKPNQTYYLVFYNENYNRTSFSFTTAQPVQYSYVVKG